MPFGMFRGGPIGLFMDDDDDDVPVEQRLDGMAPLLIARALYLPRGIDPADLARHDRMEVFILADAPESFEAAPPGLGRHLGRVVYHLTVFE